MATLNRQVSQGTDDARQQTTGTTNTNNALPIESDNVDEWIGVRFQNITIPQGSTINSAIVTFYVTSSSNDEPKHDMDFEANDNAPAFAGGSGNFNLSNRTLTGNVVQWNSADLGVGASGGFVAAPDVKTPLQAVINRAGWSSGNAIALLIRQTAPTDGTRDLVIRDYDTTPAEAAYIDIDYTAPGGGSGNARYYMEQQRIAA